MYGTGWRNRQQGRFHRGQTRPAHLALTVKAMTMSSSSASVAWTNCYQPGFLGWMIWDAVGGTCLAPGDGSHGWITPVTSTSHDNHKSAAPAPPTRP